MCGRPSACGNNRAWRPLNSWRFSDEGKFPVLGELWIQCSRSLISQKLLWREPRVTCRSPLVLPIFGTLRCFINCGGERGNLIGASTIAR